MSGLTTPVWLTKARQRPCPAKPGKRSIAVILSGAFYCAQAVGRQMLAQGRGVIVNVASVGAYQYIEGRVPTVYPRLGW